MKTKIENPILIVAFLAFFFIQSGQLFCQHAILGTTDINALIEQTPGLPNTTGEAMKRAGNHPLSPDHSAMDRFYQPFEDKVAGRIKDYQDFARQKMEQGNATEADYRREAAASADKSPIIAGMGGYEKVSKMSETEAKAAAQKSAQEYMTDPFAANGVQSAGMTALYQKIISDPAYAKKFEKMSDAEKEAELRKYMANDQPVAKTPEQVKKEQSEMAQQQSYANRIRNSQEIQLKISELQQKVGVIAMDFEQQLADIEKQGRSHEVIGAEIHKRFEAIPMVELGEYGHDHDPEQVRVLRIEEAKLQRERAEQELKQDAVALGDVADRYQKVVSEYLDYLRKNSNKIYGGTSAKDMIEGTNTEQPLLQFEATLIHIALDLSKHSRQLTQKAAGWEANYVQVMQSYQAK